MADYKVGDLVRIVGRPSSMSLADYDQYGGSTARIVDVTEYGGVSNHVAYSLVALVDNHSFKYQFNETRLEPV